MRIASMSALNADCLDVRVFGEFAEVGVEAARGSEQGGRARMEGPLPLDVDHERLVGLGALKELEALTRVVPPLPEPDGHEHIVARLALDGATHLNDERSDQLRLLKGDELLLLRQGRWGADQQRDRGEYWREKPSAESPHFPLFRVGNY